MIMKYSQFEALTMLVGIMGIGMASCKGANRTEKQSADSLVSVICPTGELGDGESTNTSDADENGNPTIPSFVKDKLGVEYIWADTICVVGDKAFYVAYSDHGNPSAIYDEDRIFTYNSSLQIDSLASGADCQFYVSIVGKTMLVDFSDASSLQALSSLSKELPAFQSYRFDSIAGFGKEVFYGMEVDFPKPSVPHADIIARWLVDKIADSQQQDEDVPLISAIHIGYTRRSNGGWRYEGDLYDHKKIAQSAAGIYFAMMKAEWGTDDSAYPFGLFSTLAMQARVFNDRFVTYQQYTLDYNGGAHGYYTERLISLDHVHNQEIDYSYLFRPGTERELLNILLEEAKKTHRYKEWKPDIEEYIIDADENGNPTGGYTFPQPGLSDEGVVFSFQPYAISCFAAGTFHFTIPYGKILHLLTPEGRRCVEDV